MLVLMRVKHAVDLLDVHSVYTCMECLKLQHDAIVDGKWVGSYNVSTWYAKDRHERHLSHVDDFASSMEDGCLFIWGILVIFFV
jgi:hypothetical protein